MHGDWVEAVLHGALYVVEGIGAASGIECVAVREEGARTLFADHLEAPLQRRPSLSSRLQFALALRLVKNTSEAIVMNLFVLNGFFEMQI